MRLSSRLVGNATTTYARLAATFAFGAFATWYMLGTIGVVGFGLIALASSTTGLSRAVELALGGGLVRELAAALASGDEEAIRRSFTASVRFCRRATGLIAGITALVVSLAGAGMFNLPADRPGLRTALMVLILAEGLHVTARVRGAPYVQALFAAQRIGVDNLLQVVARATYALSAVVVFGYLVRGRTLEAQLIAFAATRVTIQLADLGLAVLLARRWTAGLTLADHWDPAEYASIRDTVLRSSQVEVLLHISPQLLAILINLWFGLAFNGIWQIAVQLSGYARMAAIGLLRGIEPLMVQLLSTGRRATAMVLLHRSMRYQLAIVLPPAILLGVYARPLLDLWIRARLASDANLATAGISVDQAIGLASSMVLLLLAVQVLRASTHGVERGLYGLGHVGAYSWFAKWSVLVTVSTAVLLLAATGRPESAAIALIIAFGAFSVVVLRAARDEAGVAIREMLAESLPRPLLANAAFLAFLLSIRPLFQPLSLAGLATLLLVAGSTYSLLALGVIALPTERTRLMELVATGARG